MTLTALLLVGGHSRRMGADKASLTVGGRPLWSRQVEMLKELNPAALWISARIRPGWAPPGLEVVLDEPPSMGPLSGVAAALGRLRSSHLLVLAVDLPLMTAGHLRKLAGLAAAGLGVVPVNEEWFEPLCAIYPAEASREAREALQGGDVSLQSLAERLVREDRVRRYLVLEGEKRLYRNANCPADLG